MRQTSAIGRYLRLDRGDRRLLAEAGWQLARAAVAIRLLPFRRAVRSSAIRLGHTASGSPSIDRLAWAVRAAAGRAPFHAVCFQQGLALQHMLRGRGVDARLHYGVADVRDDRLRAHVWVSVGGKTVLGGEEAPAFREMLVVP